ncbi:GNAT family N-acetyltransferase [Staphylococcus sp. IVB6238]|uniref:GNAT family N-acetyltransferase n=1 Tax=Staphylococcus sp. IVB6238 TaxID=2989770 RepID=UPI0021D26B78|nr:GNAT family N-acetyltransferase [Staphylococcus sp. IVB6238]UXR73338.1 GNAT family N-acetyltransferase [Staphylococcus sp. IVB6238]
MAVSTRLFEEKDFSQINHLLQLYYELRYPTTSERLITRLNKIINNKDYYLLLLLENGKIIGFSGMCKMMFYEKNGEYMRILAFVIHSDFRKQGYGKNLLVDFEKLARKLNCKIITLNSGNRNERLAAHKLYKNSGYVSTTIGFSKYL